MEWSKEQSDVIAAPAAARLIVEAGPGTGKTAVACLRVAHLIDEQDIAPSKILVISFTRTAVAELRQRIIEAAADKGLVSSIRIATIDSNAWRFRSGFEAAETKALGGDVTYETNLERMQTLINDGDEDALRFLAKWEHIIIDEAQDVVGVRAQLLMSILSALNELCGVTVLADPLQAIYGFTTDKDGAEGRDPIEFLGLLDASELPFERRELSKIYRSADGRILSLFTHTREQLGRYDVQGMGRYTALASVLSEESSGHFEHSNADLAGRDDALIMYRSRSEVLKASFFLSRDGIAHRLRMSGLPVVVHPWIGLVLSGQTARNLALSSFKDAWAKLASHPLLAGWSMEQAWTLLRKLAGEQCGRVDMSTLREQLCRERPPVEVCLPDLGLRGPIVSTIHSSKGREANRVRVMLRPSRKGGNQEDDHDWEEECRVLYVGATRARELFEVGKGIHSYGHVLESGRSCQSKSGNLNVQVGLANDVDKLAHARWDNAEAIQQLLSELDYSQVRVRLESNPDADWAYQVYLESEESEPVCIGQMTKAFSGDLYKVSKKLQQPASQRELKEVFAFGVTTVAASDNDRQSLHEPYCDSGIFLAPVLKGTPFVFGPKKDKGTKYKRKRRRKK